MAVAIKTSRNSFVSRLFRGIEVYDKMVEPMLKHRNLLLTYAAAGWFDSKETSRRAMNFIDRGMGIVVPYLTMSNPQASVGTKIPELLPFAKTTELAENHHIEETDFCESSLRPAVSNSIVGMGITKTAKFTKNFIEYMGYLHDVGQVYTDVIDDSDYFGDASSMRREAFEFEGHWYDLPTERAKEFFRRNGKKFAKDNIDKITADYKLHGDTDPASISKSQMTGDDYHTLRKRSRFADVWLPEEDVVITIRKGLNGILNEVQWEGPERGPFDVLGYKYLPKQSYPIPPAWGWIDMDEMANVIINKLKKQAEAMKRIVGYQGSGEGDADRLASAPDNGVMRFENLEDIKTFEWGGVNPDMYRLLQLFETQFSRSGAGNLNVSGGKDVEADTLGQEQMLMSNATRVLDDMIMRVYKFAERILRKRIWYLWNDPLIRIPEIKEMPGYGSVKVVFDEVSKEGDFWDFNFTVKPFSMQRFNPAMADQIIMQYFTQVIMPLLPLAAEQGWQLDVGEFTKEIEKYKNIDTSRWWRQGMPTEIRQNPYSPTQGTVVSKSGQGDDRFGATAGSKQANSNQFKTSERAGKPSPPQK